MTANGKAASAVLAVSAGISVKTGKAGLSLSASGSNASIHGGDIAALGAVVHASGSGGARASDAVQTAVSIVSLGAVKLKSATGSLTVRAGRDGAAGAQGSHYSSSGSPIITTDHTTVSGRGDAKLALSVNNSVSITAVGGISATGGSNLELLGGPNGGGIDVDISSDGAKGTAKVSLLSGVNLTAGGQLNLNATGIGLVIHGANGLASSGKVSAAAGTVTFTDSAAVALSGKGIRVSDAGTRAMSIAAGAAVARDLAVDIDDGAKLAMTVKSGISLTATGGSLVLLAPNTGLELTAGTETGEDATISASHGGSAVITLESGISAKASGLFKLDAGGNLEVLGAIKAGSGAHMKASFGNAKATLAIEDSMGITAGSADLTGLVLTVSTGSHDAASASIKAGIAGAATFKEASLINITVAGAFKASAGVSDSLILHAALGQNAAGANVSAEGSGAVASLTADGSLTLKAGGAMTLGAGEVSLAHNQASNGSNGSVEASLGGKATYLESTAVSLNAGKGGLSVTAGSKLVVGGAKNVGNHETVDAISSATANFTADGIVSLTTTGALSLTGGLSIVVAGGHSVGLGLSVSARGAGTKAAATAEAGVNLNGGSIALKAYSNAPSGGGLTLEHGASMGNQDSITAEGHGATATALADASVSLTTKGALSVLDSNGSGNLVIGALAGFGDHETVKAVFGGTATATTQGNITLSGGTVSLIAGFAASIEVAPNVGSDGAVTADGKSKAALTAAGDVSIKATGNVSIEGGVVLQMRTGSQTGADGDLNISGSGAVASFDAHANFSIVGGGNVSLSGINIGMLGNSHAGQHAQIDDDGGTANYTADAEFSVSAVGSLTIDAHGSLGIAVGGDDGGSLQGSVNHAKVNVNINTSAKLTAGGSITLDPAGGKVTLDTGNSNGVTGVTTDGVNMLTGPVSTTKIGIDSSLTIKAGGKLNLTDVGSLAMFAGALGNPLVLQDVGGGVATASVNDNISLLGKSLVVAPAILSSHFSHTTGGTLASGGVTETSVLIVTGGVSKLTSFNPLSVSPMDAEAPRTLEINTTMSGVSFGGMQDLGDLPSVMLTAPSVDMPLQPAQDGVLISGGEPAALSTLLGDGLLTDLVAVASSYPADGASQSVDWMHLEQAPTVYLPDAGTQVAAGSHSCQALVVGDTGARCRVR